MGEFVAGLRQRIHDTQVSLRQAQESQDSYAVQIEESELEELLRIAAEHGVDASKRSTDLQTIG
jgi:hypothetical protein